MENNNLSTFSNNPDQEDLKIRIAAVREELEQVERETVAFEALLRAQLMDEIIEEQELSVLYKKLKQEKKEKRREQARRGKNYKEPARFPSPQKPSEAKRTEEDQVERKKLYREAMLFSHPDKFSLAHDKIDLATEVTTKLIEIYKTGSLEELRQIHLHIVSGNAIEDSPLQLENENLRKKDKYLENELKKLEALLEEARHRNTYKVLKEYEDPLKFVQELKAYYKDRLFKLRKRTRKA